LRYHVAVDGLIFGSLIKIRQAADRLNHALCILKVLIDGGFGLRDEAGRHIVICIGLRQMVVKRSHFGYSLFYRSVARIGGAPCPYTSVENVPVFIRPGLDYCVDLIPQAQQVLCSSRKLGFIDVWPAVRLGHLLDVLSGELAHTHVFSYPALCRLDRRR
jgi:hypothetical protein